MKKMLSKIFPKEVFAEDAYLYIAELSDKNRINIVLWKKASIQEAVPIHEAYNKLNSIWQDYDKEHKCRRKKIIPIYGISGVNPAINTVDSLFYQHPKREMIRKLSDIKLSRPFSVPSLRKNGVTIEKSIIDASEKRILIIGNADYVVEHLQHIGEKLSFSAASKKDFIFEMTENIKLYHKRPTSSIKAINGILSLALIVFPITVDKIEIFQNNFYIMVFPIIAVMLYLFDLFFDEEIYAFKTRWTQTIDSILLVLFIGIVGYSIYLGFPQVEDDQIRVFIILIFSFSIALQFLGLLANLFKVCFEYGINKKLLVLLRFGILIGSICFIIKTA